MCPMPFAIQMDDAQVKLSMWWPRVYAWLCLESEPQHSISAVWLDKQTHVVNPNDSHMSLRPAAYIS